MADTIEQQIMWCNRARMILAATSGSKQKAVIKFDSELSNVQVKLDKLIEMAGEDTPVVKGFIDKLGAIAVKASGLRDVDDPKYKGKKGQETLRKEAKVITTELEELGKQIAASKPAKEILEARTRFFKNCSDARKRLKELGSQEKANTSEVQELLAFIGNAEQSVRTEVKYQQPAECDKATRLIAEWLGRLTRRMELAAQDERKLDEAQSRAKPLVEDQAGTAQRVLAEGLTTGELTPEMQSKLEETLRQIELKGASGLWTEALALCKTLPTAGQCKKAYLLTKRALKANFGNELGLCETALDTLAPLLERSALEQERARYNLLIAQGGAEGLSTKQVAELGQKMLKLIEGWNSKTAELTEQRKQLLADIGKLQPKIARRETYAPLPQKAENARQFELVTSLRDQLMFGAGIQAAATLGRQLEAQHQAVKDGQAWQKLLPGVAQLASDLDNWSKAQNLPPELAADAGRLAKTLSPTGIAGLTTVRDWATLLAAHAAAKTFMKSASKASEKFAAFNPERGPLGEAMEKEFAKVDQAFVDFGKVAVANKIEALPLLLPLKGELRALRGEWDDWLKNAHRESKSTNKRFKAGVAALLLKVSALDDETTLKAEGERQAEETAHRLFVTARDRFKSEQLKTLMECDALKGEEFRKRMTELEGDASQEVPGKPWEKRIAAIAVLVREATVETESSRGRLQRKNETLVQSVASQKLRLAALRKSMKDKGLDVKKFAPLLDGLDTDLANLEMLTKTANLTAAEVNNRLLAELDRRVQKIQMLIEHSSTFEDYTASLERYQGLLDTLKDDGLNNVAAETYSALKEQLATLKIDLYGMDPGPAAAAERQMALALDDASKELARIRDLQNKAVVAASDCQRRVAAFAKTGVAEVYRKALEARIAGARDRATSASELDNALKDFTAIQDELSELEANPDAAYARQKNVLAEQHATLKLKREWESRLSVINGSVMSRLSEALKKGGDKSQKDEVKRMVEMAEKAVKDKKDYERGLRLLTQVEGRVAQIERNPEGTALGDRKALPKHVEGFSANVVKLRQALDSFVDKAAEAIKDKPERQTLVKEALRKQVDPLTLQLNPGLFASPLKVLLDDKAADGARREAREQALARLRETTSFLTTHPTMVQLAGNPILPLQGDMRALDAALTRLEAHLRAAVR